MPIDGQGREDSWATVETEDALQDLAAVDSFWGESQPPNPEVTAQRADVQRQVREALRNLRRITEALYLWSEGKSYSEIAQTMGVSVDMVTDSGPERKEGTQGNHHERFP